MGSNRKTFTGEIMYIEITLLNGEKIDIKPKAGTLQDFLELISSIGWLRIDDTIFNTSNICTVREVLNG